MLSGNGQALITTVRQRQLRFLGHILRRSEDEPCRRYALFAPSHGRRRPGRQATSYASYIQKLLGDTDSDLKPEAIASLAQDCSEWITFCSRLLRSRMMMMMMMMMIRDTPQLDVTPLCDTPDDRILKLKNI